MATTHELNSSIHVIGTRRIYDRWVRIAARAADAMPAFEIIMKAMEEYEKELFYSDGSISGETWPDLADTTIERKKNRPDVMNPEDILRATDYLFDSLTDSTHEAAIREMTPEGIRFGTSDEVAQYHQEGQGHVPVRKVINFNEEFSAMATGVVWAYIRHGILPV